MAALNGTWVLEKSENFEEFMKELGLKFLFIFLKINLIKQVLV